MLGFFIAIIFYSIQNDGLFESDEACVYSPSFGYYQGVGNQTDSCLFTSGTNTENLTNITIKAFSVNGI